MPTTQIVGARALGNPNKNYQKLSITLSFCKKIFYTTLYFSPFSSTECVENIILYTNLQIKNCQNSCKLKLIISKKTEACSSK